MINWIKGSEYNDAYWNPNERNRLLESNICGCDKEICHAMIEEIRIRELRA